MRQTGQLLIGFSRRLGLGVVTLLGMVVVLFAIQALVPSDPASLLAGPSATPRQVAELRTSLGLDQPLPVQLVRYVRRLVTGDLGKSLFTARPVIGDLAERLPATIELASVALLISISVGVPLGVVAALRRNSLVDHALRVLTVSGFAVASFWLAIMLQMLFVMRLGWLPLSGRIEGHAPPHVTGLYLIDSLLAGDPVLFGRVLGHLALPAATLAFPVMATIVRFTRAGVLDSLGRPSVQYLLAMGLPPSLIVWKYVLRAALTSVATQVGLVSGALLGGSVVVEAIFDWPGLGYYMVNSVLMSDYNAVLGATVWIAGVYVVVNMLVDMAQRLIDPRAPAR
jgi:peptide/nickel transport system permease protein